MKRWWWAFEPDKWLADEGLRACSWAARGLWIEMLCLMAKNSRVGYLAVGGKKPSDEQLAQMLGIAPKVMEPLIKELVDAEVCSSSDDGILYSRKMVREHIKATKCSEAGKKGGGNPTLKGQAKGTSKQTAKGTSDCYCDSSQRSSEGGSGGNGLGPGESLSQAVVDKLVAWLGPSCGSYQLARAEECARKWGERMVLAAIEICLTNNVKNWSYLEKVCENGAQSGGEKSLRDMDWDFIFGRKETHF